MIASPAVRVKSQRGLDFDSGNGNLDVMRKLAHEEIGLHRIPPEQAQRVIRVPLVVVLDSVRSLYNVGSIFRTADGAMIEKLVLGGFSPHPPRKEIDKTALGATQTVPWEYVKSPAEAVRSWKSRGYQAVCLELTDRSVPYYEVQASDFPMCLVIGNEITGVSADALRECDRALEIPMYGMKQSLNVSVAFGIAVYELGRIWRQARRSPLGGQSNTRV